MDRQRVQLELPCAAAQHQPALRQRPAVRVQLHVLEVLDYTGIPIYRPLRTWSYGFDGSDQTHNAVFNFTYNLPRGEPLFNDNKVVKWVFDDWMLSGIAQWVSGTPASISFSTVQGTDLTGGGDGQRVNVVGDPNANGSTFYAWFNPAAFAVPGKGDPGNAAKNSVRNPGRQQHRPGALEAVPGEE